MVHRVALGVLHGKMHWIVHLPIGVVLVHREAEGVIPSLLLLQSREGRHFCFPLFAIGFICSLLGYVRRTGTLLLSTPGISLATVTRCARDLPSLIGLYRCHSEDWCAMSALHVAVHRHVRVQPPLPGAL